MFSSSHVSTITVIMEPLYRGQLDGLPQGGSCIITPHQQPRGAQD
jgi:hypothetical protein